MLQRELIERLRVTPGKKLDLDDHDPGCSAAVQRRNSSVIPTVEIALRHSKIGMVWEVSDLCLDTEFHALSNCEVLEGARIDRDQARASDDAVTCVAKALDKETGGRGVGFGAAIRILSCPNELQMN